jgi:hypothetical protein
MFRGRKSEDPLKWQLATLSTAFIFLHPSSPQAKSQPANINILLCISTMSVRTKLFTSAVAPVPMTSSLDDLSEPLIPKDDVGEEGAEGEEETTDPLSSIGIIIGSVLLGAAG